jgi:Domain of unknown function (DUF397)
MTGLPPVAMGQAVNNSEWRKSTKSLGHGECVEVMASTDRVAVRDSKGWSAEVLIFPAAGWRHFLAGLRSS